jgi:general stress protein 26
MSAALSMNALVDDEADRFEKLRSLVDKIRFCMMTTIGLDGVMHSRPMSFLEWSEGGNLLFFTRASSTTMRQIESQRIVNLGFCDPSHNVYVSISGEARVLNDAALKEKLFAPIMNNWFPGGAEDPSLRLISVIPVSAHERTYFSERRPRPVCDLPSSAI